MCILEMHIFDILMGLQKGKIAIFDQGLNNPIRFPFIVTSYKKKPSSAL